MPLPRAEAQAAISGPVRLPIHLHTLTDRAVRGGTWAGAPSSHAWIVILCKAATQRHQRAALPSTSLGPGGAACQLSNTAPSAYENCCACRTVALALLHCREVTHRRGSHFGGTASAG